MIETYTPYELAEREFKTAVRGYDRDEVDAYIARLREQIAASEEARSPSGAVMRALEQVGDEVSGILQRAHETANTVTESSQREADIRLERARNEAETTLARARVDAAATTAQAQERLAQLDLDTDRIWAERDRIVTDARELARQLIDLADAAAARFPPEEIPPAAAFPSAEVFPTAAFFEIDEVDAAD